MQNNQVELVENEEKLLYRLMYDLIGFGSQPHNSIQTQEKIEKAKDKIKQLISQREQVVREEALKRLETDWFKGNEDCYACNKKGSHCGDNDCYLDVAKESLRKAINTNSEEKE
jgi:hypothetical protein